jgi:hypothetical protein
MRSAPDIATNFRVHCGARCLGYILGFKVLQVGDHAVGAEPLEDLGGAWDQHPPYHTFCLAFVLVYFPFLAHLTTGRTLCPSLTYSTDGYLYGLLTWPSYSAEKDSTTWPFGQLQSPCTGLTILTDSTSLVLPLSTIEWPVELIGTISVLEICKNQLVALQYTPVSTPAGPNHRPI